MTDGGRFERNQQSTLDARHWGVDRSFLKPFADRSFAYNHASRRQDCAAPDTLCSTTLCVNYCTHRRRLRLSGLRKPSCCCSAGASPRPRCNTMAICTSIAARRATPRLNRPAQGSPPPPPPPLPACPAAAMSGRQQAQPSGWDSSLRSPAQRYLSVDGTRVKYIGPGGEDRDAAAVRANHPVPSDCPLYYFEVEITSRGRDGFIGGWCGGVVCRQHWERGAWGQRGAAAAGCVPRCPCHAACLLTAAGPLTCMHHAGIGFSAGDVKLDRLPGWEPHSYG